MDLTEKTPVLISFQVKESGSADRRTIIKRWTKCNHDVHLSPISVRLKPIFRGTDNITVPTKTFFR